MSTFKEFISHIKHEYLLRFVASSDKKVGSIQRRLLKRMLILYASLCVSAIVLILLLEVWAGPIVGFTLIISVLVLLREAVLSVGPVTSFGSKSNIILFYGFMFPTILAYITFVISAILGGLPLH